MTGRCSTSWSESDVPLDTEAGVISELFVEHAFEDVLSRSDDREQMAAVGVTAAALGLSGPSTGMAVMSSEGGAEPVVRVRFMLGDLSVSALLWNWPFREGQSVRVVGKRWPDGTFFAISVLDEDERLIVSYPHVTAGSTSHWLRVFWISLAISVVWWGGRLFSQLPLFGTSNPIVKSKLFLAPVLPEPQFLE